MKYNLSAVEILKFLGYCEPVGREKIKAFEQANQMILPESYRTFMELADGCHMLDTGDVWNGINRIHFYYDILDECILDQCVLWDENPEAYQKDELYQLSQIPKEEWKTKVANVLEIGCDYGGGIVMYGITPDTMQEKNPPLYFHHEVDPCTLWRPDPTGKTISDFLLDVVLNELACIGYGTAEEALEEMGWEYTELSFEKAFDECIQEAQIDLNMVKQYGRCSYLGIKSFCCCDEEKNILYVGYVQDADADIDTDDPVLYQISRAEE